MAMRVLTLERLGNFIEDRLGSKQTMYRGIDCIQFISVTNNCVSCSLPFSQISDLDEEVPFLKFRDQVSGVLCVDGVEISDEDIKPYSYLLD